MLRKQLSIAFVLLLAAAAVHAADPESGTINADQHSVEWTGGPFLVPNLTPTVPEAFPEPLCEEGTPTCDVFRFTVNFEMVDPENDQLVISVSWQDDIPDDANPVFNYPDYDIYLYDETCTNRITDAATANNPEIMFVFPDEATEWQNKTFCVVVIPFTDTGVPYAGEARFMSFGDKSGGLFGGALAPALLIPLAAFAALARRRRHAG